MVGAVSACCKSTCCVLSNRIAAYANLHTDAKRRRTFVDGSVALASADRDVSLLLVVPPPCAVQVVLAWAPLVFSVDTALTFGSLYHCMRLTDWMSHRGSRVRQPLCRSHDVQPGFESKARRTCHPCTARPRNKAIRMGCTTHRHRHKRALRRCHLDRPPRHTPPRPQPLQCCDTAGDSRLKGCVGPWGQTGRP